MPDETAGSPPGPQTELFPGLIPASPQQATTVHEYISTACFHGKCGSCRNTCKFCGNPCRCDHHGSLQAVGAGGTAAGRLPERAERHGDATAGYGVHQNTPATRSGRLSGTEGR